MKLTHGLVALALTLAATAAQAELTGTVTGVSDYDFRGISQTAKDPAIQGSIDYSHSSGFYIGAWGSSSLDFNPYPNQKSIGEQWELDTYGGFRGGKDITYDVGLIWYSYPGTDQNVDYGEVYAGAGWKFLSGKIWYSPDFGSSDSRDGFYYEGNFNYSLPANFGVSAHVGYSDGKYWDYWYNGGYTDWSVGVTYTISHFTVGLKWIDGSDLKDLNDFCRVEGCASSGPDKVNKDVFSTDARAVLSISTTFPWKSE
jgi:uncharacterized protein (TIGR02001 family)